jgi:hypothetical protein
MTIRRLRRRGLPLALIAGSLVLLQASECKKGKGYYTPVGLTGGGDNTGPVFTLLPIPNTILNDVMIMATITDPSGVVGETVSATGNDGADLAISSAGVNMYNADISNWEDGLRMVEWSAFDEVGNEGTETQTFTVDRTDPDVSFTQMPDPTGMSDQATADLTYNFTITEPHFASATFGVFNCNTGAAWPEGTDGGQVEDQSQTFTTTGSHTATFRFHNGNTGTSDIVAPYCFNGTALDAGVTKTQQPAANSADFSGRVDFTWKRVAGGGGFPSGTEIQGGWSGNRTRTSTTGGCPAPIADSWTGSASFTPPNTLGLMGWDSRVSMVSGTYNQPIGSYEGTGSTVLGNGFEVTARISGTFNFTGSIPNFSGTLFFDHRFPAGGTLVCTEDYMLTGFRMAPSSVRFKRGVAALLPDGVTILGLRPVAFRYVEPYGDPAVPQMGLIAEEVVRVFPEAVALGADGQPLGIEYGTLTGLVIREVETRAWRSMEAAIARLAEDF